MQKESADDSDRVDDAVDPRVQVSAVRRRRPRVARTERATAGQGGEERGVPAVLTLSLRRGLADRLNRAENIASRDALERRFSPPGLGVRTPVFLANVSYLLPSPSDRSAARPRTHTRMNHKTSPIP